MSHPRIRCAHFLLKAGAFIKSLALCVMKPADLIEMNRRLYADPANINSACDEKYVASGLRDFEKALLKWAPKKGRNLLLLGVGSGREALVLAAKGFNVTGVDFVPEVVDYATKRLARDGYRMKGLVQEISQLNFPDNSFDIVWLSYNMYSSIPTRQRRISMLQRISRTLKPDASLFCQFLYDSAHGRGRFLLRKLIAVLMCGNFQLEQGDHIHYGIEFAHAFTSKEVIRQELQQSEMNIRYIELDEIQDGRGYAILSRY